jgi:hypothetical protein
MISLAEETAAIEKGWQAGEKGEGAGTISPP